MRSVVSRKKRGFLALFSFASSRAALCCRFLFCLLQRQNVLAVRALAYPPEAHTAHGSASGFRA